MNIYNHFALFMQKNKVTRSNIYRALHILAQEKENNNNNNDDHKNDKQTNKNENKIKNIRNDANIKINQLTNDCRWCVLIFSTLSLTSLAGIKTILKFVASFIVVVSLLFACC